MPNLDYLNERLATLGITDELNTWVEKRPLGVNPDHNEPHKFFYANDAGDIVINYFNLQGMRYRWRKQETDSDKGRTFLFSRTRLRVPKDDQKYSQAKGSGQFPFFTPAILKKCKEGTAIETLVIVEGEFKAFKAAMHGLDAIGIPSIHGFYNGDIRGRLHEDIQELIITAKVRNVVFVTDADTLTIKWEEGKDLAKRQHSFIAAVKMFRESLQLLLDDDKNNLTNIYFSHLLTKFNIDAKGLDDLLTVYTAVHDEIRDDLLQFQFARKYFAGFMLNDYNSSINRLKKHFGVTDEKEFYQVYRAYIGDREFNFNRRRYHWNDEQKEVEFVKHEDAEKFMRIGGDYLKIIKVPNKHGNLEDDMIPFKKGEIIQDYGKGFIDEVPKYDSFIVDPNFNGNYQRVVSHCYNLMAPMAHVPKEGTFNYTTQFLKHIFPGQGTLDQSYEGDPFTVAIDYLTLLFREPKHMLPVPILVSKENETGKSTFFKWLQAIYTTNMVILNNEQFKSKFNAHYISKYIIAIDEGFLDVDKKNEKERLKQLVTADQMYLELKGINLKKIRYYGKVMIGSNDEERIMKIDSEETRWFVNKVPVIKEKDPDLEAKMYTEIPAWLYYLKTREVFHPRKTRLWFTPENIITQQFKIVVENTKNRVDRVFEDWIREQFLTYHIPVLRFTKKYLTEVFNDPKNSKYRIDAIELGEYLKKRLNMEPEEVTRFDVPVGFNEDNIATQPEIRFFRVTGRPFVFDADKWLTPAELKGWYTPTNALQSVKQAEMDFKAKSDDLPF